jgi:hypothetical protein
LGWVISEEPFFKNNVRWVDQLKVRVSGGLTGMDNTRAYNWLKSYNLIQTGNGPVFGGNLDRAGIFRLKNAMPNRDVSWDDDTKLNGGIDASFLRNRLNLTIDGFYDHRYNMLTTYFIGSFNGRCSIAIRKLCYCRWHLVLRFH